MPEDFYPALRLSPGPKDTALDKQTYSALQAFARLAVVPYNQQHTPRIVVKTLNQAGVEVTYLANAKAFPPGVQPAFALKEGYLVLASSPAAVARFGKPRPRADAPLLRLSLRELGRQLEANRPYLTRALAERQNLTPAAAAHLVRPLATRRQIAHGTLSKGEPLRLGRLAAGLPGGHTCLSGRVMRRTSISASNILGSP